MGEVAERPSRLWLLAPWAIFAASILAKLLLIVPYAAAPAGLDELTFLALSDILRAGDAYPALHYPPLYPLSLVPATLFPDVYRASIALGCVYSSALVLPMWLLARDLFDERRAAAVALVAALMPFQYSMPRVVMSETLFYPLLMAVVYLAVTNRWKRLAIRDALFGAMAAGLFLTRYMALVFGPALLVVWFMREWERTRSWRLDRSAWGRLLLVLGFAGVVLLAWGSFAALNGYSWSDVFQVDRIGTLSATASLPARALTFGRFARFALAYLASWALWLAPVLGLIFMSLVQLATRRSCDLRARLVALLVTSAVPLLYVVTHWAWRAPYNWPRVLRIMDRYSMYLVALGILAALASLGVREGRERFRSPIGYWLLTVVLPLMLLACSWWVVFRWGFLPQLNLLEPGFASADTYHVLATGGWFWPVAVLGLLGCAWAYRYAPTRGFLSFAVALTVFFAAGLPTYVANASHIPVAQLHSERVFKAIETESPRRGEPTMVWVTTDAARSSTDDRLARHMRVRLRWMLRRSQADVVIQIRPPRLQSEGIILMSAQEPRLADAEVVSTYELEGERFVIVSR